MKKIWQNEDCVLNKSKSQKTMYKERVAKEKKTEYEKKIYI